MAEEKKELINKANGMPIAGLNNGNGEEVKATGIVNSDITYFEVPKEEYDKDIKISEDFISPSDDPLISQLLGLF